MPSTFRISELSTRITQSTARVDEPVSLSGLQTPSFSPHLPPDLYSWQETSTIREDMLEDIDELQALMWEPMEQITRQFVRVYDFYILKISWGSWEKFSIGHSAFTRFYLVF